MGSFQSDRAWYVTANRRWRIEANLVTDSETGVESICGTINRYERRYHEYRTWLFWTDDEEQIHDVFYVEDRRLLRTPAYVLVAVQVVLHIMRAKLIARNFTG
jgi:hypothetical protein